MLTQNCHNRINRNNGLSHNEVNSTETAESQHAQTERRKVYPELVKSFCQGLNGLHVKVVCWFIQNIEVGAGKKYTFQ